MASTSSESSSVLFSLNELMNIEQDRIAEEKAREAAKLAAEADARLRADEAARRMEEQRLADEQARREADAMRAREEAARLDAIRIAELERARIGAERQAEADRVRLAHDHERSLALLEGDASKRRLKRTLIATALVSLAVIGAGAGIYFGKIVPEAEAERAAQDAVIRENSEAVALAKRQLDEERAQSERLREELASVTDEKRRIEIESELEDVEERIDQWENRVPPKPPAEQDPKPPTGEQNEFDPLNESLP